ncbi:MAG TPA: ABC transporter ATP-binding protein [Candidatus Paceibacterota bacterium]|nr:ABC transporter ATP-binding protein [Candidatus Paceibacterota bacterium]
MALIEIKDLKRYFITKSHTTQVLNGITFTIDEGSFVAIVGRSGAGKSTLLYQLALLDTPSEGTIIIDGQNTSTFSEKQFELFRLHTLGYVFQDYALIPDLTVAENILFPLHMRNIDKIQSTHMLHEALDAVDLRDKKDMFPTHLSGGEQQRVSIARAVAGSPRILFADEPTANLDSRAGRRVIDLLTKINQQGKTVVMVTHDLEYTESCSRIIELNDGVVISDTKR